MSTSTSDHLSKEMLYSRRATPFTKVWYWGSAFHGALLVLSTLFPLWQIHSVPPLMTFLIGMFQLVGGIFLVRGSRSKVLLSKAWAIEQFGCFVASAGWLTYGVTNFLDTPADISDWSISLIWVIALVARFLTLIEREDVTRRAVSKGGSGE